MIYFCCEISVAGPLFIEQMGISVDPRKRELLEGRFMADKVYNTEWEILQRVRDL